MQFMVTTGAPIAYDEYEVGERIAGMCHEEPKNRLGIFEGGSR